MSTLDYTASAELFAGQGVDINFVVFRIKDAQKYLFNIQKPDVTVKEVAESAMRDIVGQSFVRVMADDEPSFVEVRIE